MVSLKPWCDQAGQLYVFQPVLKAISVGNARLVPAPGAAFGGAFALQDFTLALGFVYQAAAG